MCAIVICTSVRCRRLPLSSASSVDDRATQLIHRSSATHYAHHSRIRTLKLQFRCAIAGLSSGRQLRQLPLCRVSSGVTLQKKAHFHHSTCSCGGAFVLNGDRERKVQGTGIPALAVWSWGPCRSVRSAKNGYVEWAFPIRAVLVMMMSVDRSAPDDNVILPTFRRGNLQGDAAVRVIKS